MLYSVSRFVFLTLLFLVVALLRDLFVHLGNASQKAISPEYDLAYMALLNEKEEPEPPTAESSMSLGPRHAQASEEKLPDATQQSLAVTGQEGQHATTQEQYVNPAERGQEENMHIEKVTEQAKHKAETRPPTPVPKDDTASMELDAKKGDSRHKPIGLDEEMPPSYEEATRDTEPAVESGKGKEKALPVPASPPPPPPLPQKKDKLALNPTANKRVSAANMMFGKQQDVTGRLLCG